MENIGLLTGGGDCPGLNAVIRAVVRTAILRFNYRVYGIVDGFDGLVQPHHIRELTLGDVHHILPLGGTVLGTSNRGNPFDYEVEENGVTIRKDMTETVISNVQNLDLKGVIVIGGDGTLTIAHELAKKGFRAIGVPKTIDNDLESTDVTFGFESAVNSAVEALDKLRTTAESHQRIMILEVMGRNAGWIAMYAGLAGGAHVILIPEIPYGVEEIVSKIRARESKEHRNYTLIVIAEGAFPEGQTPTVVDEGTNIHGRQYVGAATSLAQALEATCDEYEVRVTVLGHLQRGGSPTPGDRTLATRFGVHAVECIHEGLFDHMVTLRNGRVINVPLQEAAGRQRLISLDNPVLHTARQIGISFGDQPPPNGKT
tara:strand:+ start:150 stop:1262 length:1113 start_codon:yes stop_codon:yes gene_type:complete